ncbi:unnamed protein product, partial [Musa acuminata subsp. burmannicoides]
MVAVIRKRKKKKKRKITKEDRSSTIFSFCFIVHLRRILAVVRSLSCWIGTLSCHYMSQISAKYPAIWTQNYSGSNEYCSKAAEQKSCQKLKAEILESSNFA